MKKISLYDYLGRKAGQELGLSVATAAGKAGVTTETRYVETKTYKGDVNLYPNYIRKLLRQTLDDAPSTKDGYLDTSTPLKRKQKQKTKKNEDQRIYNNSV